MTDREKLIELFEHDDCPIFMVFGDNMEGLADHLISHGVTFATDNNVGDKWIPVTERLPNEKKIIDGEVYYRNVAVRVKNLLHERVAYYDPEHECWYDTGFFQIRGVTHWAKLPEWEE